MSKEIKGIAVAMVTPFKEGGEIDEDALCEITKYLINSGIHVLIPCGSTGEFSSMSEEERKTVNQLVVREARGRVPVIAGTSGITTQEALRLTEHAREIGADAAMVMPTYYFKPSEEELYEHYKRISGVGLPVALYNNPWTTKVDISVDLVLRLAKDGMIRYVKEASGEIKKVHDLVRLAGQDLTVFAGADDIAYEAMVVGAKGWVAGVANIIPRQCVELHDLVVSKRYEEARELYFSILPLLSLLESSGKYTQNVKFAAELIGLRSGSLRDPLLCISEAEKRRLKDCLKQIGALR